MDPAAIRTRLLERLPCRTETAFVDAGGVRTFCLTAGDATTSVVLLHGGGGGAIGWAPVLPALSAVATVIAPDLPGYGESAKPAAAYDAVFYTDWLAHLLTALGRDRVTLVGCSLGAAVALHFALARPEHVARLVLGTPLSLTVPRLPTGMLLSMFAMHLVPCHFTVGLAGRYLIRAGQVPADMSRRMVDYALAVLRQPGGRRAFLQGRNRLLRPIDPEQTAELRPPPMVIWGGRDRLVPPAARRAAEYRHPGFAFTTIADAGHIVFADAPQRFAELVLQCMGITP